VSSRSASTRTSPRATSRASCISMPARKRRAWASCMHLDGRDAIASTHRGHGHCIAKGVRRAGMMFEIFGKDGLLRRQGRLDAHRRPFQGHDGRQRHRRRRRAAGSAVPPSPPSTAATGGVAICLRRRRRLQPGHHLRELNLAKVWNLPAIFVVEDNGYAESTSREVVGGGIPGRPRGGLRHAWPTSRWPRLLRRL
jgi:acetoin:2,6-dichlorophenolindophenol oxidoreductase subunit alpha